MAACEQPCLWSLICAPPPESPRPRRRRDDDDARRAAQVAQARRSATARQCAPFAREPKALRRYGDPLSQDKILCNF